MGIDGQPHDPNDSSCSSSDSDTENLPTNSSNSQPKKSPKKKKKKLVTVKAAVDLFIHSVGIPGLLEIWNSDTIVITAFWIVVLLIVWSIFFYYAWIAIIFFIQVPIRIVDFVPGNDLNPPFPSITICVSHMLDLNQFVISDLLWRTMPYRWGPDVGYLKSYLTKSIVSWSIPNDTFGQTRLVEFLGSEPQKNRNRTSLVELITASAEKSHQLLSQRDEETPITLWSIPNDTLGRAAPQKNQNHTSLVELITASAEKNHQFLSQRDEYLFKLSQGTPVAIQAVGDKILRATDFGNATEAAMKFFPSCNKLLENCVMNNNPIDCCSNGNLFLNDQGQCYSFNGTFLNYPTTSGSKVFTASVRIIWPLVDFDSAVSYVFLDDKATSESDVAPVSIESNTQIVLGVPKKRNDMRKCTNDQRKTNSRLPMCSRWEYTINSVTFSDFAIKDPERLNYSKSMLRVVMNTDLYYSYGETSQGFESLVSTIGSLVCLWTGGSITCFIELAYYGTVILVVWLIVRRKTLDKNKVQPSVPVGKGKNEIQMGDLGVGPSGLVIRNFQENSGRVEQIELAQVHYGKTVKITENAHATAEKQIEVAQVHSEPLAISTTDSEAQNPLAQFPPIEHKTGHKSKSEVTLDPPVENLAIKELDENEPSTSYATITVQESGQNLPNSQIPILAFKKKVHRQNERESSDLANQSHKLIW